MPAAIRRESANEVSCVWGEMSSFPSELALIYELVNVFDLEDDVSRVFGRPACGFCKASRAMMALQQLGVSAAQLHFLPLGG